MQIEQIKITDIKPFEKNPRDHSPKQIDNIAKSIKKFGFVNPILITDDHTIIAGHGRLLAAQKLKMETVPVIVIDHLNDDQIRELIVADNAITMQGGWNMELLDEVLAGLDDLEYLELPTIDEPEPEPDDDDMGVQKQLLKCPSCGYVNEQKAFKNYENTDESL